jgi:acetyl-CoA synthetase
MISEQTVFQPNAKLARQANVSSLQQYNELYSQSIDSPQLFWANIAKQFHWETKADPENFFSYNFDISKGPIDIKWMPSSSTNISYNILDRNVKNGLGETVAFYW